MMGGKQVLLLWWKTFFSGKAVSQGFSALSLNILDQLILVGRNILCIVECLASYFPPSIAALCSRASISKKIAQNKRQWHIWRILSQEKAEWQSLGYNNLYILASCTLLCDALRQKQQHFGGILLDGAKFSDSALLWSTLWVIHY